MDYNFEAYDLVETLTTFFTTTEISLLISSMPQAKASAALELLNASVSGELKTIGGGNAYGNYAVAYCMNLFLYFAILMFGTLVITAVISEKSTRAMELLIVSAKPEALMFGKVFAVACAGLMQLLIIVLTFAAFIGVNIDYWNRFNPQILAVIESSNLSASLVLMFALFFVMGFFSIAFINAALASTVSKTEDSNAVSMISIILEAAAFSASLMAVRTADSSWVKILSFIPPFSYFVMVTRLCMGSASYMEALFSLMVLTGSVFFLGMLASKIYRIGVTMYGQPFSLNSLLKTVFKEKSFRL
jgi:ABC-2 type transport system permease protein